MVLLPHWERPVNEGIRWESGISPEEMQCLRRHLFEFRKLYELYPAWQQVIPRSAIEKHIPHPDDIPMMLSQLSGVGSLHGAKVLYLDDGPEFYFKFLAYLTLATRRRVERIFYHGESVAQIVSILREKLRLCPQPHLLIVDENLEMLPSVQYAGHTEKGHEVIRSLRHALQKAGVTSIGFSTNALESTVFRDAGADGFVRKNIPPQAIVEQMAGIFHVSQQRLRLSRDREENFLVTD